MFPKSRTNMGFTWPHFSPILQFGFNFKGENYYKSEARKEEKEGGVSGESV